jgi:peptidoglycan/LPS O-acetylase OafA/YrhL
MEFKSGFRADINGLRALAVIAVVVFHFSSAALPGGFVGVDVFFAISGYLMTGIIMSARQAGNFSYKKFLLARIRRIVPALAAVCLLVISISYAILDPKTYAALAGHVRDSLLFFSNITYESEAGYFDEGARTKFLLHSWSLSVEWQFYLLYPLTLLILLKILSKKMAVGGLLIMAVASLASSFLITVSDADLAYFMLYTRAWEMLVGGLAYFWRDRLPHSSKAHVEATGLLIVMCSFLFISEKMAWPGYLAIIPIMGTFLCLISNNPNTILSGPIFNKLGIWSYSIYLVHWPILAFDYYLKLKLEFKWYILITLILSYVLHTTVERRREFGVGFLVVYLATLLLAWAVLASNGVKSRFAIPDESAKSLSGGVITSPNNWIEFNTDAGGYDVVFYGDSFAAHYGAHLQTRKDESIGFLFAWQCFSTPNYYSHSSECQNLYGKLKEKLLVNKAKVLVVSQAWLTDRTGLKARDGDSAVSVDFDEYVKLIHSELKLMKHELGVSQVIVLGSNYPFVGISPSECISDKFSATLYKQIFSEPKCSDVVPPHETYQNFNAMLENYINENAEFQYFSPNIVFCGSKGCSQIQNGKSLFSDPWHFSSYGADLVGERIFDFVKKWQ